MSQVLIEFVNDVIDETSEEYELILGKVKEETKSVEEWYKYVFAGISVFLTFIIVMMSTSIIPLFSGMIILFTDFVAVLLILLVRQQRMRELNDAYGVWISILGSKKRQFLKIRKDIHYWEYIRNPFPPNVIRNTLIALETIDAAYTLYRIETYEKLLSVLKWDDKKVTFYALVMSIKGVIPLARDMQNIKSKLLPFFIHDEINKIFYENKKYIPDYFMEPNIQSNYEVYVSYKDYINFKHGNYFNFIKEYNFKESSRYIRILRRYEFLLDENFNVIKSRLKKKPT